VLQIERELNPNGGMRWHSHAIMALQEAVEAYLVHIFEECNVLAIYAKMVKIMKSDLRRARRIRGVGRVVS